MALSSPNSKLPIFQNTLKTDELDGFIVTNPVNIFYLTGFKGVSLVERESILIFSPKATLITAMLYMNEAEMVRSRDLKVKTVRERDQMFDTAIKLLVKSQKTGFEEDNLTYGEYKELKKTFFLNHPRANEDRILDPFEFSQGKQVENDGVKTKRHLIPIKDLIESMRLIKSNEEIALIEKAQTISQKAFAEVIKTIKIGETEAEIAERLQKILIKFGADGSAFDSIVACGPHSGFPHYVTGKRRITKGEVLLFDFGAKYSDYCADLSRTVFVGKAKNIQKNIFWHVLAAQKEAISKIKSGLLAKEAFEIANNIFKEQKIHNYFIHGLGHGVGLEVHEAPYLRAASDEVIKENMVFSVEPGLYFNWGGVRIEDLVVIENSKAKVLGGHQAEFIEI